MKGKTKKENERHPLDLTQRGKEKKNLRAILFFGNNYNMLLI